MSQKVDTFLEENDFPTVKFNKRNNRYECIDASGEVVAWVDNCLPDDVIIRWFNGDF